MKNILVTGSRGFIMFNGLKLWKTIRPLYNFICIDANTYADKFLQNEKNKWLDQNNIPRYEINISSNLDILKLDEIIKKYNIDTIIHAAAESHVDSSISNPNVFFETNIIGTVNLLNLANKYKIKLLQVSTDEVYGETTPNDWLNLNDNELPSIKPSSPYSSSKASAELIALSYYRTFGTDVMVSRCSNNFGKYQHTEKLIPTVITKILKDQKIPVYGKGNQKRHWIYVDEHNKAIMNILEKGKPGTVYNIAPLHDNYITNLELIKFILDYMKKPYSFIEHVTDRLGHDVSYYMEANYEFTNSNKYWKDDMKTTVEWYKEIYK